MVLEFNRPATVAASSAAPADAVRVADAGASDGLSEQRFSLQAAPAQAGQTPPASAQEASAQALMGAASVEQGNPEQWLQGMLGQRELQVEAREQTPAEDVAELLPELPAAPLNPEPLLTSALPAPVVLSGFNQRADDAQQGAEVQTDSQLLEATALLAGASKPVAGREVGARELAAPVVAGASVQSGVALALHTPLSAVLPELAALSQDTAQPQVQNSSLSSPVDAGRLQQRLLLDTPQARWGEQMLQALRESVDVQLRQQVQSASIRLDPPELGSMEIFLSHESGRLNVQISASNGEVARLLQQTSDRLRQELVASNFLQVNVQVGSDGQSGRQSGRTQLPWALDEVVAANHSNGRDAARSRTELSASDVLVTV